MDTRWKQRFNNFSRALASLKVVTQLPETSDIEVDAGLQRFEIAFELAWKTLQDYLVEVGYEDYKGPKRVIGKAFQDRLIENGETWLTMHEDRNIISHVYDFAKSRAIFEAVCTDYLPLLNALHKKLEHELDD